MSIRMIPGTSLPKEFVSWLKEGRVRWLLRIVALSGVVSAVLLIAIGFVGIFQSVGWGLPLVSWAVSFYAGILYALFYTPWVYFQIADELRDNKHRNKVGG